MSLKSLENLTKRVRHGILTSTTKAGSGHPTSSLSAVEIMTTLFFDGHYKYDFSNPKYIFNDRLIFSKGHAAPLLYSLHNVAGVISNEELLSLRELFSNFEGHPTPRIDWVDVATGSLGQGLSVGVGMALGIKLHNKIGGKFPTREPRVYVLLGDSEFAEGQIYEAMQLASFYKLNNLVAFLDMNRLGQRGETMLGWDLDTYKNRVAAFGWNTVIIEDGNNLEMVQEAFKMLHPAYNPTQNKPTMIIAKTKKGAGVSFFEDKDNWHGKPLPAENLEDAINELGIIHNSENGYIEKPELINVSELEMGSHNNSTYEIKDGMATREAYGEALKKLSTDKMTVVLDAETSNSTFAEKMKEVAPDRFLEMFIAEQNMVSVALGLSKLGFKPYSSTFAAFLTRAFDQIRMTQYSNGNIKIAGSHAGVSIGVDGSSQMALEDLSMMRSVNESVIFYPSDAVSTLKMVEKMHDYDGISYIRLTREKTPLLYKQSDEFEIGGSKVLKSSSEDKVVIFTAGITVHEALKAHENLKNEGINVAVVDIYSVKPLDLKTIREIAKKTNKVVIVEDHYSYGGLGEAILSAIADLGVKSAHLAVRKNPRSGKPQELLELEEIDAKSIVACAKNLITN